MRYLFCTLFRHQSCETDRISTAAKRNWSLLGFFHSI